MGADVRLVITERPVRRDHLHGAWWPHTTDIERELAPMLSLAVTRLRAVLGVSLNRDEWPGAALELRSPSMTRIRVSWYGLTESHLAVLHCGGQNRIALLVLPPDTPKEVALTAMLMASSPGNSLTTAETLTSAQEHVHCNPDPQRYGVSPAPVPDAADHSQTRPGRAVGVPWAYPPPARC
jgi:hypothetical protein